MLAFESEGRHDTMIKGNIVPTADFLDLSKLMNKMIILIFIYLFN